MEYLVVVLVVVMVVVACGFICLLVHPSTSPFSTSQVHPQQNPSLPPEPVSELADRLVKSICEGEWAVERNDRECIAIVNRRNPQTRITANYHYYYPMPDLVWLSFTERRIVGEAILTFVRLDAYERAAEESERQREAIAAALVPEAE